MAWSGWPYRIYFAATSCLEALPGFSKALTTYGCTRALRRINTPSAEVLDVVERAENRGMKQILLKDKSVWFHAASLGEAYSVMPLVQRVVKDTRRTVHFSFNSASALAAIPEAVAPFNTEEDRVICHFLPLDLPRHAEMFLDEVNPCLGVFVESELWPNLIHIAKGRNVKLALVNARISDRSLRRWQACAAFEALLLEIMRSFDVVYCKTEATKRVVDGLGLAALAEYRGDLKTVALESTTTSTPSIDHLVQLIPPSSLVWIAGSTHEGEEMVIAEVHEKLSMMMDTPVLTLIAPRHPERAGKLKEELEHAGLEVVLRSTASSTITEAVLLLDTLGELRELYGRVNVAFVGASLPQSKQKGGHNTLEALNAGVQAVLQGPDIEPPSDAMQRGISLVHTSDDIATMVQRYITPLKTKTASCGAHEVQVLTTIWCGLATTFPEELM